MHDSANSGYRSWLLKTCWLQAEKRCLRHQRAGGTGFCWSCFTIAKYRAGLLNMLVVGHKRRCFSLAGLGDAIVLNGSYWLLHFSSESARPLTHIGGVLQAKTAPSVLSCLGRGLLNGFHPLLACTAVVADIACKSCARRFRLAWSAVFSTAFSTPSFRAASLAAVTGMTISTGACV